MTAEIVYGGIATAGIVLGWVVRGAFVWGETRKTVKDQVEQLRKIWKHVDDTDIHLVKGREDKTFDRLESTMKEGFGSINKRFDTLDGRCEKRLQLCHEHFSQVDRQLAAITGREDRE